MKFLCFDVAQPGVTVASFKPYMLDEVRHAWQQHKSGFLREIYVRQDRPGVVIIAECGSLEEARQALNTYPLAEAGLINWEIIPLGPFLNWEMLFAPDAQPA